MPKLDEKLVSYALLASVLAFIITAIALPFSQNSLQSTDMPGHLLQAAAYVKDVLWPSPIGWDYRFFAGYPLHQYYGPLFAWLVALLGFIVGLEAAFKAVLIAAVLATPLSAYYCARSFSFPRIHSSALSLLFFAAVSMNYGTPLGSDFLSVFYYGFVSNGFATPLLFLYIGSLKRGADRAAKGNRGSAYIIPSVLLALVSLAHVYVGLTAWIFTASYAVVAGRKSLQFFARHALLSALLAGFWAAPLAAKLSYSVSEGGFLNILSLGGLGVITMAIVGASIVYLTAVKKDREIEPLVVYFAVLLIAFTAGMVARSPFQLYRFFFPAFAVSLLLPIRAIAAARKPKLLAIPVLVACAAMAASLGSINYYGPDPIAMESFGMLDGRLMDTFQQPSEHAPGSLIAATSGNLVGRGLYAESAANSRYFGVLETDLEKGNRTSPAGLQRRLSHFGVNWMLADSARGLNYSERIFAASYGNRTAYLFKIADNELVEVLNYTPLRNESNDWKAAAAEWFWHDRSGKIAVLSEEELPDFVGTGSEKIELQEFNEKAIRVNVDSDKPVPVFLKFSYFPNWQAYVNGEKAKVYHVLPALMLVYGHGDIELRYEQLPVDIAGWALSTIGIALLALIITREKPFRSIFSKMRSGKE
jgi:hypothetical protein